MIKALVTPNRAIQKIVGFVRILFLQDRSLVSPRLSARFMLSFNVHAH